VNKQYIIIAFCCFFYVSSYSQEINIIGKITDKNNRGIESASVSIFNQRNKNLAYNFSDQNGNFRLSFKYNFEDTIKIEISCLGYKKLVELIDLKNINHNFILQEKSETLREVVIESGKKIKINQDTTFIKVDNFTNKTEQTVEDILKKLPGIVIKKDGTITAHGKAIDKLLIEGEDIFDANYKILTKNLDAKVLEEVQIIDNFEDNPIFKKLNNSDKVALNLKFKKGFSNVWFGNVTVGASISEEKRWKEGITIGLLKNKIKGLYFNDFNNLGEKSTDLFSINVNNRNNFSSDRLEYKAKPLYNIENNEIQFFSKTQSIFNKALLNSLSFSSKLKKSISIRGMFFIGNDNQFQNSFATTKYNLGNNPIIFNENNYYLNKKKLSSSETEIKFKANEKNYITNLLIIKNNPSQVFNTLLFNYNQIAQDLNSKNFTFYNHFNYTLRISEKVVLNNYIYLGNDKVQERLNIKSPLLNKFFGIDTFANVKQIAKNRLSYFGIKSKVISKFKKIDFTNSIQFEYKKEELKNSLFTKDINVLNYQNDALFKTFSIYQENTLRYNFNNKIDLTASFNIQHSNLNFYSITKNIFNANPFINFSIKKTSIGNFTISYLENNTIPDINQLTTNFYLSDYRSFLLGTSYNNFLRSKTTLLNYYFYNDEKRYSLNISAYYINSKSILNTLNNITNDLSFISYVQTNGSKSYNTNISLVNYSPKLKLASKIENVSTWLRNPLNVNSNSFLYARGFTNLLKYSGTTYFKKPINLDFSISYNYFQSIFQSIKTKNSTCEGFLNINYKAKKTLILESNNSIYIVNNQNFFLNNIIFNFNPIESKLSFRLILNNIFNVKQFTNIIISDYTYYKYSTELVPRYLLFTMKYRF